MEEVDAVIFDRDGVLLRFSSYDWINKAKVEKAKDLDISLTESEAEGKIFSDSVEEMEAFLDEKGMTWSEVEEISRHITEKQKERMRKRELDLYPGVRQLLENLDVPVGLVSNASLESTRFFLKEFKLKSYFDCVKAPHLARPKTRVKIRKPNPIMLENVMCCLSAESPIFLGDSEKDRDAAERAKVKFERVEGDVPKLLKEFGLI